jgi:hypothetical protein
MGKLLTWMVAAALPLGLLLLPWVYYPLLLASGTLNLDADSIAIPIMAAESAAVLIALPVLALTWFCLRGAPARPTLLAWDGRRPLRSTAATFVLGGAAAAFAAGIVADLTQDSAWYDYLWEVYGSLWVAWFMLLRAALVAPRRLEDE